RKKHDGYVHPVVRPGAEETAPGTDHRLGNALSRPSTWCTERRHEPASRTVAPAQRNVIYRGERDGRDHRRAMVGVSGGRTRVCRAPRPAWWPVPGEGCLVTVRPAATCYP